MAQQMAVGQTAEELARARPAGRARSAASRFYEFRSQGRLGCPHDYVCFQAQLEPLILNIHGETEHVGKVPKRCPQRQRKAHPVDPAPPRNEGGDRRGGLRAGLASSATRSAGSRAEDDS